MALMMQTKKRAGAMAAIEDAASRFPISAAKGSAKKMSRRQIHSPSILKITSVTLRIRNASPFPALGELSAVETRIDTAIGSPAVESNKKKE